MAQPFNAVCIKDYYKASRTSGQRPVKDIIWIVLHDEEAPTAKVAAAWFHNPNQPPAGPAGSAHLCVDDNECYRCLDNVDVPWGAPGANKQGFHIEQAGLAKWSAALWMKHWRTIRRAAYKSALHCKAFDIPVQFCNYHALRAGTPGITTHREVSKAFGGTHTDPGPFYPLTYFMYWCRRYRKQMD